MKKIAILGLTGSIGTQALEIIRENRDKFGVSVLTCGKQVELLADQIAEFNPELVCVEHGGDALSLNKQFPKTEITFGKEGLKLAATSTDSAMVLNALVGMRGLEPTIAAIEAGKDIALANKETLVAGGAVVMKAVSDKGVRLIPVDSEHSAIFQALKGNESQEICRILLTASGGPFRGYDLIKLSSVTREQALKHPNWIMGSKITINSATMMNKGLEVIEASWLFNLPPEKIEVIVQKESIIHSMVEYSDRSIIAQLGTPDMKVPISYAFAYPDRLENNSEGIDFLKLGKLNFEPVDMNVFRCLGLAYEALRLGGSYPVVLNAANEVLVQRFLEGRIKFLDIQTAIEGLMEDHTPIYNMDIGDILEVDRNTRERVDLWG